jgi:hypothetical protein
MVRLQPRGDCGVAVFTPDYDQILWSMLFATLLQYKGEAVTTARLEEEGDAAMACLVLVLV